jgi:hypothetical protein
MEAIATDLLDSGPFYVLLGRRDLSIAGLHDSRAFGTYQRLESYEWKAGATSIPGQPGHLTYLLGASRSDRVSRIVMPVQDRQ